MIDKKVLDKTYKELLEEKIINHLAEKKKIPIRQAMNIYYRSKLSQQINDGSFGIENMDHRYLVEDLIENEPELFEGNAFSDYSVQEKMDLILFFLSAPGGVLEHDIDEEECVLRFVNDGCADTLDDDWYEINEKGHRLIDPFVKSISEDMIQFVTEKRYGRSLEELYTWFSERYEYKDKRDAKTVVEYLLMNIHNFGFSYHQMLSIKHGNKIVLVRQ